MSEVHWLCSIFIHYDKLLLFIEFVCFIFRTVNCDMTYELTISDETPKERINVSSSWNVFFQNSTSSDQEKRLPVIEEPFVALTPSSPTSRSENNAKDKSDDKNHC